MPMPRNGQMVECPYCGEQYYKKPSDYKFNKKATCGAPDCKTKHMSGKNNPFWGRTHSTETIEKIKAARKANPTQNVYRNIGYKHTDEARSKMSTSLKERWTNDRDQMMKNLPRGEKHHNWMDSQDVIRHRNLFTPSQKKRWLGDKCFYCGSTDTLGLDHIIPVKAGGSNTEKNAQTLCQQCNKWKFHFVDKPLAKALKDLLGPS